QVPPVAGWSAVGFLHAGGHERVQAWSLEGALSHRWGRIQVGAGTLFQTGFLPGGAPRALSALAVLKAAQAHDSSLLFATDRARPPPRAWPQVIEDSQPIAVGTPEATAYSNALAMAYYTSNRAFEKVARKDLTYAHLFNSPARYRGEVVRVEGRLRRVNR